MHRRRDDKKKKLSCTRFLVRKFLIFFKFNFTNSCDFEYYIYCYEFNVFWPFYLQQIFETQILLHPQKWDCQHMSHVFEWWRGFFFHYFIRKNIFFWPSLTTKPNQRAHLSWRADAFIDRQRAPHPKWVVVGGGPLLVLIDSHTVDTTKPSSKRNAIETQNYCRILHRKNEERKIKKK